MYFFTSHLKPGWSFKCPRPFDVCIMYGTLTLERVYIIYIYITYIYIYIYKYGLKRTIFSKTHHKTPNRPTQNVTCSHSFATVQTCLRYLVQALTKSFSFITYFGVLQFDVHGRRQIQRFPWGWLGKPKWAGWNEPTIQLDHPHLLQKQSIIQDPEWS